MGVTEAVGEEVDRESWEEAEAMAIREDEEPPSEAESSLFISSLLLRDTGHSTAPHMSTVRLTQSRILGISSSGSIK